MPSSIKSVISIIIGFLSLDKSQFIIVYSKCSVQVINILQSHFKHSAALAFLTTACSKNANGATYGTFSAKSSNAVPVDNTKDETTGTFSAKSNTAFPALISDFPVDIAFEVIFITLIFRSFSTSS